MMGLRGYCTNGLWANLDTFLAVVLLWLPFVTVVEYSEGILALVAFCTLVIYAKILYFLRCFESMSFLIAMVII